MNYSTLAVHAGQHPDPLTGAVNVPVYLSSTFELTGIGTDKGWDYSRAGNPTRDRLETALAALEGGHSGHAFASGMAAIYALVATLKTGDHVICSSNVYGGTQRLFNLSFSITASRSNTWTPATSTPSPRPSSRPRS